MNHVSVSPTDGNGPTQGQRKTLTRVGIEPTTYGLDHRHSSGREQAVRNEDVNVTAMKMYKYKEGLRFCKRSYIIYIIYHIISLFTLGFLE